MERLVVDTVVYRPAEEVYEFLLDFPGYANYSKYLQSVRELDSGGENPRYALRFAWWKLTYTAHSEVTETVPPERIAWHLVGKFDAGGRWVVDPLDDVPADAPDDAEAATEVHFEVEWDDSTVHSGMIELPMFVSLDRVVRKATPLVETEAKRVVERAVADLEGRQRPVSLTIRNETV